MYFKADTFLELSRLHIASVKTCEDKELKQYFKIFQIILQSLESTTLYWFLKNSYKLELLENSLACPHKSLNLKRQINPKILFMHTKMNLCCHFVNQTCK